ncbi:Alpha/beta hydrolase family-domain-containing protein [Lipomyces oligophaga]|uniref:Alpha/beta hydrolase family-domain-containing protein n=1 Tax=Lipomyces oligophaga TaxID=45792 RepID=UPI0034CD8AB6
MKFAIEKVVLEATYPRTYATSTQSNTDRLSIAVNRYKPTWTAAEYPEKDSRPEITIVAAHANGFPKELYEPLFEDLVAWLASKRVVVRELVISDVVNQGESGVLNEAKLGNRVCWLDYGRDIVFMIQSLQLEGPLIGLGHSLGGSLLLYIESVLQPGLFAGLICIEPIVDAKEYDADPNRDIMATVSSMRRDLWPSVDEARKHFLRNKFYQAWDIRVFDRWIKHGLRRLPTRVYPTIPASLQLINGENPLTLTTTKYQEVFTFTGPSEDWTKLGISWTDKPAIEAALDTGAKGDGPMPVINQYHSYIYNQLENLTKAGKDRDVLLVYGKLSNVYPQLSRQLGKLPHARWAVLQETGHLAPLEQPGETAALAGEFIIAELDRYARTVAVADSESRAVDRITPAHETMFSHVRQLLERNRTTQPPGRKSKL